MYITTCTCVYRVETANLAYPYMRTCISHLHVMDITDAEKFKLSTLHTHTPNN